MSSTPPPAPPARGDASSYRYDSQRPCHAHAYLMPSVEEILNGLRLPPERRRVFDLGCGNGAAAARLASVGYEVSGVDPSTSGIAQAHAAFPDLDLHVGSGYEDLAGRFGTFPVVMSLEVIEHVYDPRTFVRRAYDLVEPGGTLVVSTPYHGYLKNLAPALTGQMDAHFTALWDHGHIKFWSQRTLRIVLEEAGFRDVTYRRVGRVPALAKSMIAVTTKPA